jgi:hypothetical protein
VPVLSNSQASLTLLLALGSVSVSALRANGVRVEDSFLDEAVVDDFLSQTGPWARDGPVFQASVPAPPSLVDRMRRWLSPNPPQAECGAEALEPASVTEGAVGARDDLPAVCHHEVDYPEQWELPVKGAVGVSPRHQDHYNGGSRQVGPLGSLVPSIIFLCD